MKITSLIALQKKALKTAPPKSRDRIRHRLHILMKARQIRQECRAA